MHQPGPRLSVWGRTRRVASIPSLDPRTRPVPAPAQERPASEPERRRFVIYGSGRLAIAVARHFRRNHPHATVALVGDPQTVAALGSDGVEPHTEQSDLATEQSDLATEQSDLATSFKQAGLRDAACLLALNDSDEENIRAATVARDQFPTKPVVIHTFDPRFADLLEQGERGFRIALNIRRAYSMAGLAAPFFVALALEEKNLVTMRFGDTEIPISQLKVGEPRSPLAATPAQIRRDHHCEVVAVKPKSVAEWRDVRDDDTIEPGSKVVIGGPQARIFELAYRNRMARIRADRTFREAVAARLRHVWDELKTLLHVVIPSAGMAFLIGLLVVGVAVTALLSDKSGPIEWPYRFIRTALGEQAFEPPYWWLRVLGTLLLLLGAVVLTLVFARITTETTARKLVQNVRAQQLREHVIIAGIGELGYRVAMLLEAAGIRYAAIDPDPDDRFLAAVTRHGPVIAGDIRLEENLENAGVRRACAVIACSRRNLANVEACMRAEAIAEKRGRDDTALQPEGRLQTVARVFDDPLAEKAAHALGINKTFAAVEVAAPAFVDAATHEWAKRAFWAPVGATDEEEDDEELQQTMAKKKPKRMMLGYRLIVDQRPTDSQIAQWRNDGVRVLALREIGKRGRHGRNAEVLPPSQYLGAGGGSVGVVVAGRSDVIEGFVERVEKSHGARPDGGEAVSGSAHSP